MLEGGPILYPHVLNEVFQRTDCPGGDTSLPGQDSGLEKAGPWAVVAGQVGDLLFPLTASGLGLWSWLMNLQICCCVLAWCMWYLGGVFSNDKLVIPTSPTV